MKIKYLCYQPRVYHVTGALLSKSGNCERYLQYTADNILCVEVRDTTIKHILRHFGVFILLFFLLISGVPLHGL